MIHMPYAVFAVLSISLTIVSMVALMAPLEALLSDLDRSRAGAAPRDPLAGTLVYVVAAGAVALLSFSMLFYAAFCGDTRAVETVDGPYALVDPDLFGSTRARKDSNHLDLYLEQPDGSVKRVRAAVDDLQIVRDGSGGAPTVEVVRTRKHHAGTFLFLAYEGSVRASDAYTYRIHIAPSESDIWGKGE